MKIHFYLYFILLAVNLFYGFSHYKALLRPYKTLVLLLAATFVEEALIQILLAYNINKYPVYHVFAPIQYLFFCIIYSQFNFRKNIVRYYSIITVPLLTIFTIINRIYFENQPKDFPSHVLTIMSVLMLIHILYTYQQMLQNFSSIPLYKQDLFWFNTANLLNFTSNFFFWVFFNARDKENPIVIFLTILQAVVTLITYTLYGLSLYYLLRKKQA